MSKRKQNSSHNHPNKVVARPQLNNGEYGVQIVGNDNVVSLAAPPVNDAQPQNNATVTINQNWILIFLGIIGIIVAIYFGVSGKKDIHGNTKRESIGTNSNRTEVMPVENSGDYNVALNKPVSVKVFGDDPDSGAGGDPQVITDGKINYSDKPDDKNSNGVIGWVNRKDGHTMTVEVTIDLHGLYEISEIRYTMGDVSRASSWNADEMITPLGSKEIERGSEYKGAWTRQIGKEVLSSVHIQLLKTKESWDTDWLFIGEIEVYGHKYHKEGR